MAAREKRSRMPDSTRWSDIEELEPVHKSQKPRFRARVTQQLGTESPQLQGTEKCSLIAGLSEKPRTQQSDTGRTKLSDAPSISPSDQPSTFVPVRSELSRRCPGASRSRCPAALAARPAAPAERTDR
eukprot:429566-Rhodomonas_salina.2